MDSELPVFFDTGATLSYLPEQVVTALADDLGAQYNPNYDLFLVPCGQQGSINFTFGNFTINVGLEEFVWQLSDSSTCALGAMVETDNSYILGASFLRSVYGTILDCLNRVWNSHSLTHIPFYSRL